MINFSAISQTSFIGRLLRIILKFIPRNVVVPILQGTLKGKKWIKGSGVNGYWLGSYELTQQRIFTRIIKNGDIVFDVGAHVGFYTLLASQCVGDNGHVFAFEPLPANIAFLKKHILINQLHNIIVVEAAVGDNVGAVRFDVNKDNAQGRIAPQGDICVNAVTLDYMLYQKHIIPPHIVKIDVEGEEYRVLRGGKEIIKQYKPRILLSTHGEEAKQSCLAFLKGCAYAVEQIETDVFFAKPA